MKIHYLLFALLFFMSKNLLAQEEAVLEKEQIATENELLYNTLWELDRCEPEFDNSIAIKLLFEKEAMQLKVIRQITSSPKLQGTKLITNKTENMNFYSWKYGSLETTYEGDDVVDEKLDYTKLVLFAEGYEFKIKSITNLELVLEVIKAPKVIFGKSIFNVKKMYLKKSN